jgi:hypothetical protein
MLHKISDFCNKIDKIKELSDKLRVMKYSHPKANDTEIDDLIQQIQFDMYILSQDKQRYEKNNNTDVADDTC